MKFQHLKIGQQFNYQGETYVKTTPLVASHVTTGQQKLIPRYATITVTDTVSSSANKKPDHSLNADQVQDAFDKFFDCYLDSLEMVKTKIEAHTLESMQNRLENARQQFFKELGLQSKAVNRP